MPKFPYSISAVSYLNTKPFLYGLERSSISSKIVLTQDTPAICANKLLNNEVDIGLVPVAIIPQLKNPQIVVPFCIGADGCVATVCLFSTVPIEEITMVYLDYQSRTSVALVQILLKEYWKKEVQFLAAYPGYENEIKGTTAAVIIGDRAIPLQQKYAFQYDLADAWKQHTGLPFVFAAWVSCKPIAASFLNEFNAALEFGIQHKHDIFEEYDSLNNASFSVENYLTKNIHFYLNTEMQKGLELFLKKISPSKQVVYCF